MQSEGNYFSAFLVISGSINFQLVKYKKLHINLPKQPLVNQRPWLIIGLLLAFIFLLATAYAYVNHKGKTFPDKPASH